MNCARLRQVLDAWLDGELDRATGAEIAQPRARVPGLRGAAGRRVALAQQLRADAPYYPAPPRCARVQSQLRARPGSARRGPTWLQAGALRAAASPGERDRRLLVRPPAADSSLREQVVASHVASLGARGG